MTPSSSSSDGTTSSDSSTAPVDPSTAAIEPAAYTPLDVPTVVEANSVIPVEDTTTTATAKKTSLKNKVLTALAVGAGTLAAGIPM